MFTPQEEMQNVVWVNCGHKCSQQEHGSDMATPPIFYTRVWQGRHGSMHLQDLQGLQCREEWLR